MQVIWRIVYARSSLLLRQVKCPAAGQLLDVNFRFKGTAGDTSQTIDANMSHAVLDRTGCAIAQLSTPHHQA